VDAFSYLVAPSQLQFSLAQAGLRVESSTSLLNCAIKTQRFAKTGSGHMSAESRTRGERGRKGFAQCPKGSRTHPSCDTIVCAVTKAYKKAVCF
jgi:hypothetical protein